MKLVISAHCGSKRERDNLLVRMDAHVARHFGTWSMLQGRGKNKISGILKKSTDEPEVSRRSKFDIIHVVRYILVLLVRIAFANSSFLSFCAPAPWITSSP